MVTPTITHPDARYHMEVIDMARQPSTKAATKKAAAAPTQEDTVTVTDTAAPADQAPVQDTPQDSNSQDTTTPAQSTPAVVDTSSFDAALATALDEMDKSTGTLAEGQIAPVIKAYQELDGAKAKAAVRASIERGVQEALSPESGDIPKARALNTIRGAITSAKGGGGKAAATPQDPTEAFVEQVVAIQLAYSHVTQNVPEGVADDWNDRATKLASETVGDVDKLAKYNGEGEAPEVSALAKRALKLATGKVKSGGGGTRAPFTGTRRDIGKHIIEAFADKNSGDFLTVAQIVSHHSSEYGTESPSPGAVSARLFPKSGKCTLEGVVPVDAQDGQPKGARKA
jgi:hypothetical protein